MTISRWLTVLALGTIGLLTTSCASTVSNGATNPFGVRIVHSNEIMRVELNGRLFTEYHYTNVPRPFCYPLIGPGGGAMTRNFPMVTNAPAEERDHPHHRSCWFTHGDVNGVDYWSEGAKKQGRIVVTALDQLQDGPVGVLSTTAAWIDDTGHKVLDQKEEVRIKGDDRHRIMDLTITLTPTDKDATFGDTKEGSFSVRLTPLKESNGGVIINSEGATGMKGCWGKKAKWVDYSGTLFGSKVGLLRGGADGLHALRAVGRDGDFVPGRGAGPRTDEGGRPGQDGPSGRPAAGRQLTGRRADVGVGAGCGARGAAGSSAGARGG